MQLKSVKLVILAVILPVAFLGGVVVFLAATQRMTAPSDELSLPMETLALTPTPTPIPFFGDHVKVAANLIEVHLTENSTRRNAEEIAAIVDGKVVEFKEWKKDNWLVVIEIPMPETQKALDLMLEKLEGSGNPHIDKVFHVILSAPPVYYEEVSP